MRPATARMARIALASLNRIVEQEISPMQIQVNKSRIKTMGKVRNFKTACVYEHWYVIMTN